MQKMIRDKKKMQLNIFFIKIFFIMIKLLWLNQILALNNPYGVIMLLNKPNQTAKKKYNFLRFLFVKYCENSEKIKQLSIQNVN